MSEHVVVVGADAAGMSAAHQMLRTAGRTGRELAVTVLEQGIHTSYSACGIPYWMAGDVDSADELVARTAEQHRDAGIDLRFGARVAGVDLTAREVALEGGERVGFDQLVVATGAHPIVPGWALGADGELPAGVRPVKTLDDGQWWIDRFAEAGPGAHVVVVGGGYIGLEVAEAALRRGHGVTLVTRSRVMSSLEPELSERVALALCDAGVEVVLDADVTGLVVGPDGAVTGVRWDGGARDCDLLVLALGVVPATEFLDGCELSRGEKGALRPDPHGRVAEGVWAAGDCCAVYRRLAADSVFRPLGTHANKMGRALGDSLAGGSLAFEGVLETAITRFAAGGQHVEVARTGLSREDAVAAGYDPVAVVTEGSTASGYMDEADPVAIWVMADRSSRRLLGVQVVGGRGAGKRIDTAAAVLWMEGTVDDLAWMDLSYSPPFSTTWEVLGVAARRTAERM
ncbi:FAD-dependent oxidoreductase [Nocardioides solisilvae]|uniref:FAD-dependent oxidoreductase n=1 Tax=Nocardioides solisilvae TaxID=1542435 RepID=UPI000D7509DA|nr:FAD-dependent oxidoreductase [Nocardioides solisilvae]